MAVLAARRAGAEPRGGAHRPRRAADRLHAFTKVPLRDADGQVSGLVCIGRDVTDQREAERALARERNLLRTLMDNLPDHIFVKDTQSRFLIANAATLRSLGAPSPERGGRQDRLRLPARTSAAEQFYADEQEVLQHRPAAAQPRGAAHRRRRHGAAGCSTTKVPLRGADGEVIGLVGISHDITDRKTMEAELRRGRGGGRGRQPGQERVPGATCATRSARR